MVVSSTARSPAGMRPLERRQPAGRRHDFGQVGLYLALFALSALFMLPFLWLVLTSLKPPDEVFSAGWLPDPFYPENYADVFQNAPMARWILNTLFISLLGVASVILSSSLVAYGFSRLRFRGRRQLFALVIATYLLPAGVTLIPTFLIWNELGLVERSSPSGRVTSSAPPSTSFCFASFSSRSRKTWSTPLESMARAISGSIGTSCCH